jgi:hypothetical protein
MMTAGDWRQASDATAKREPGPRSVIQDEIDKACRNLARAMVRLEDEAGKQVRSYVHSEADVAKVFGAITERESKAFAEWRDSLWTTSRDDEYAYRIVAHPTPRLIALRSVLADLEAGTL